jgi:hypothetical protein
MTTDLRLKAALDQAICAAILDIKDGRRVGSVEVGIAIENLDFSRIDSALGTIPVGTPGVVEQRHLDAVDSFKANYPFGMRLAPIFLSDCTAG